jgi:hypothetical protein
VISLDFKTLKGGFFDRKVVLDALDKATFRIFSEFGRKVRKTAQKSLKYGEKASPPGSPPTAHKSRTITKTSKSTGRVRKRSVSFLREYLYYAFDRATRSVVIGPARLNSTIDPGALQALEYGGTATVKSRGKRSRKAVAARPFMRPAAAAELPNLPPMWRDSVR